MPFCTNCGKEITAEMKFCPFCGAPQAAAPVVETQVQTVTETVAPVQPTVVTQPAQVVYDNPTGYRIILIDKGYSSVEVVSDLLEDMFGYTDRVAKNLIRSAPAEIAHSLTEQQAYYLAEALSEYGVQVSIADDRGAVTLPNYTKTSVFNNDGSYGTDLMNVIASLSVLNQVSNIVRWSMYDPRNYMFMPFFRRPEPPIHFRRPGFFGRRGPGPDPMFGRPAPAPRPPRGPHGGGMAGGPRGGGMGGGPRGGGMGSGPRGGGMGSGPRGGGMGSGPRGGGMSGGSRGGRGGSSGRSMGGPGGRR